MRELISKLVAGGLSAAVILLWWPQFFPADNATTWLVRGVVWTLSFELMVHALLPIEAALWESHAGRRLRTKAGERITAPRQSVHGRAAVACAALAVPVALLVLAPAQPAKSSSGRSVRHVTEVKRIVKVERRQVRVAKVVPVPAATSPSQVVYHPPATTDHTPPSAQVTHRTTSPPSSSGGQSKAPAKNTPAGNTGSDSSKPTGSATEQPVKAPRVVRRSGSQT